MEKSVVTKVVISRRLSKNQICNAIRKTIRTYINHTVHPS
jgi:hypothetical protein